MNASWHFRKNFRYLIILTSIALSLIIAIGYALYYQYHRYPLELENIAYDDIDTQKIGALNRLQITLNNEGEKTIIPKFWIKREGLVQGAAHWDILEGSIPLPPHSHATYLIGTEIPEEMISSLTPVTLEVNDIRSYEIKTLLRNFEVRITSAPILNPHFKYWLGLFKKRLPFQWRIVKDGDKWDKIDCYQKKVQGRDGITLQVYQDGQTREKEWIKIFLEQLIKFPSFDIQVWVHPTFKYVGGENPIYLYGVEARSSNYVIRYVFSDAKEAVHILSPTSVIIVRHARLHQWTLQRLNIQEDFLSLNWKIPEYIFFKYFLGVHTKLQGDFKGHFGEILF